MRVRFSESFPGFVAGETVDLPGETAERMIAMNVAVCVEGELPVAKFIRPRRVFENAMLAAPERAIIR
jgi:hypothetical protein